MPFSQDCSFSFPFVCGQACLWSAVIWTAHLTLALQSATAFSTSTFSPSPDCFPISKFDNVNFLYNIIFINFFLCEGVRRVASPDAQRLHGTGSRSMDGKLSLFRFERGNCAAGRTAKKYEEKFSVGLLVPPPSSSPRFHAPYGRPPARA